MRGLDPRIRLQTVIPGRALCAKLTNLILSLSERTRNPEQCIVLDSGSAPKRAHPGMTCMGHGALAEAEQLEQRREVAELLARGRRGAADEVEDLAVLQPVI